MELNIQQIAQSLVDELLGEQKKITGIIQGVNLLYSRLVMEIEKNNVRPEVAPDSLPSGDAQEAQPASPAASPEA